MRSNQYIENLYKHYTMWMLDIEDSRSFKSNQDNGELLELSHPQNVGYWDTEEARIFQIKSRFVEPLG